MKTFLPFLVLLALPACDNDEPVSPVIRNDMPPIGNLISVRLLVHDAEGRDLVAAYREASGTDFIPTAYTASWDCPPLSQNGEERFERIQTLPAVGDTAASIVFAPIISVDVMQANGASGTASYRFVVPALGWTDTISIEYDWATEYTSHLWEYVYSNVRLNSELAQLSELSDGSTIILSLSAEGLVEGEMW